MGEEGIEHRLSTLECENRDRKKENEDRRVEEKATGIKIVEIEKLNIKQDISLTIIMGTLKIIAGTFIAFVITNICMYLLSKGGFK